jgi:hypothetical protein
MNLYKVKLQREQDESLRHWKVDSKSYYYVEAESIEEAIAEAKRMNPNWDIAPMPDSADPAVEVVVEGISS